MTHKQAIQRNFGKRRATYDRHAQVQQWMGLELLRGCREALWRARRVLEVGCGTGYLTDLIRRANPRADLVALDLEFSLLQEARRRVGGAAGVHFSRLTARPCPGGATISLCPTPYFSGSPGPGRP